MSLPRWWNNQRKQQNERSRKQEENHATRTGGQRQAGSGSSWRRPQDVREPDRLAQVRYTDKKGYRISLVEWLQIRRDALNDGRQAVMIIDFDQARIRLEVTEVPYD